MSDDVVIKMRMELEQAKAWADVKKTLGDISVTTKKSLEGVARAQQQVYVAQERLNKSLGKIPFAGYAMSVMFLGMAMQNMFNRIWTTSSKVFDEVSHSVDGVVTGFDLMNGALNYLGYEVGRALEPIAAFLAPIITGIADFVSQHQGATTAILAFIAVVGTLLSVGGSLKLAWDGLLGTWAALSLVFPAATAAIAVWATKIGAVVGGPITLLIAAFIAVMFWLNSIKERLGGWGAFFKTVFYNILTAVMLVTAAIAGAFAEAWKWIKVGWNGVVSGIQIGLNAIIGWLNTLISAFNAVTGSNIGRIKPLDMSSMKVDTSGGFVDTYSNILGTYGDWVNAKNAPQTITNITNVYVDGMQIGGDTSTITVDDLLLNVRRG